MDIGKALFLGLGLIGVGTLLIGSGLMWWISIIAEEKKGKK